MSDNTTLTQQPQSQTLTSTTQQQTSSDNEEPKLIFTNEKEIREFEFMQKKAQQYPYTFMLIRVKKINDKSMENILFTIEASQTINHLRFEDGTLSHNAALKLSEFLKTKMVLEVLGLSNVQYEDAQDQKRVFEGIIKSIKLKTLILQQNIFEVQFPGEIFRLLASTSRSIRELDLSFCEFRNPALLYDLANGLMKETARLHTLKLRQILVAQIDCKVLSLILKENKTIFVLDLSLCYGKPEHFEFLSKMNFECFMKQIYLDRLNSDISIQLPVMGEALATNQKLECLSLKENKFKTKYYCQFWRNIMPNRTIRQLILERTKVSDKVIPNIAEYLLQDGIQLQELNLNRNAITGKGLTSLARALRLNSTLKKLYLGQNQLQEEGMDLLAQAIIDNHGLEELSLAGNSINNSGLMMISNFVVSNMNLKVLDLSKNSFGNYGLQSLASALEKNVGLVSLNLAYNYDITDTEGLIYLAQALYKNKYLQSLDITKIPLKKPCLRQNFLPALEANIFLQKLIGRYPPNIISDELADNVVIEQELITCYSLEKRDNNMWLKMQNKRVEYLRPGLKLIRNQSIECVDFSNMQICDDQMLVISNYVKENPPLRKIVLNDNIFTDIGLQYLIEALFTNHRLNYLSLMRCQEITNESLKLLYDLILNHNMCLYSIEIDITHFDKQLAVSVIKESALNRSIQKNLKPYSSQVTNGQHTVKFQDDAKLIEHFDSVVKCYRIMLPQYINICNQELADEHIEKLSQFLMNQNVLEHMILRRNSIGDKGAECLAEFIERNEKHFTYMEISRNRITDIGANRILKALRQNTRIVTFLVNFGNLISPKVANKIAKEIKANQNIVDFVRPSLTSRNDSFGRLAQQDKGPEFIRCALKSVSALSILYLDLSDNLLTYKEARKISTVISENVPLRGLNLSNNLLDPKSALLFSEALRTNTNLLDMNLSYNKIGDQGISQIILPLAKQKLILAVSGIQSSVSNIRIRKLYLGYNEHTEEALKHVYALMFADKNIVVDINNPKEAKLNNGSPTKNSIMPQSPSRTPNKRHHKKVEKEETYMKLGRLAQKSIIKSPEPKLNRNLMKDSFDSTINPLLSKNNSMQETFSLAIKQGPEDKPRENFSLGELKPTQKFTMAKFCCGGKSRKCFLLRFVSNYNDNKREARMFKCNENVLSNVENISQRYITVGIYISTICFYFSALVLPLTEEGTCSDGHQNQTYYFYGIYAILSLLMEFAFSIYLQKKVEDLDTLSVNKFHCTKLITGQLARADFFTDILFMVQMYKCEIHILLSVGCLCLFLSSIYQFFMLFKLMKRQKNHLLENIERNCKLAYITEHQTLATILDSFSLSNFESVGKKTVTIPKIVSSIKSFVEDLPQFAMQVVYILLYSKSGKNTGAVVVSILLGIFSFGMSVTAALHAKTSNVNMDKVQTKIQQRCESMSDIYQDEDFIDENHIMLDKMSGSIHSNYNEQPTLNNSSAYLNGLSDAIKQSVNDSKKRVAIKDFDYKETIDDDRDKVKSAMSVLTSDTNSRNKKSAIVKIFSSSNKKTV